MRKAGRLENSEVGNRRSAGEVAAAVAFRVLGVGLLLWWPSLLCQATRMEVRFDHASGVRVIALSDVDWMPLRNLWTCLAPRRTVHVKEGARSVWLHDDGDFPVPADAAIKLDGRRIVFIPPAELDALRFAVDLDSGEMIR